VVVLKKLDVSKFDLCCPHPPPGKSGAKRSPTRAGITFVRVLDSSVCLLQKQPLYRDVSQEVKTETLVLPGGIISKSAAMTGENNAFRRIFDVASAESHSAPPQPETSQLPEPEPKPSKQRESSVQADAE